MLIVEEIKRICLACPTTWEGITATGGSIFVHYRWGYLSIREDKNDNKSTVCGTEIFGVNYGDLMEGFLSFEELKELTADFMILPENELNGMSEDYKLLSLNTPQSI